jgi:hypothetical protein
MIKQINKIRYKPHKAFSFVKIIPKIAIDILKKIEKYPIKYPISLGIAPALCR